MGSYLGEHQFWHPLSQYGFSVLLLLRFSDFCITFRPPVCSYPLKLWYGGLGALKPKQASGGKTARQTWILSRIIFFMLSARFCWQSSASIQESFNLGKRFQWWKDIGSGWLGHQCGTENRKCTGLCKVDTILHCVRGGLKSSEMSLDRGRSKPGEVVLGPTKRGLSSGLAVVLSFWLFNSCKENIKLCWN